MWRYTCHVFSVMGFPQPSSTSVATVTNPTRININRARTVFLNAIDYGHFPPVMKRLAYHNNRLVGGFQRRSPAVPLAGEFSCWCGDVITLSYFIFPRTRYLLGGKTCVTPYSFFYYLTGGA